MAAFLASLLFVVLAEMGDKTQLLAMAFAARYPARKVLLAVFLATIVNHALAVATGQLLTVIIPLEVISFIAALSFIVFGLWTVRGDKLEGEDKKTSRFGPVLTVGIAFFLAEMGDKTQLATISLAVKYKTPLYVLLGSTLGMVIADAFGIIVGTVMHKHIPERTVKWISACIFILFGFISIYQIIALRLRMLHAIALMLGIGACTALAGYFLTRPGKNPS